MKLSDIQKDILIRILENEIQYYEEKEDIYEEDINYIEELKEVLRKVEESE